MTSKTKINQKMKRKTNKYLAEAIFLAKKSNNLELAEAISAPRRKRVSVNLEKINKTKGKTVIIPGRVLSSGNIDKKIQIYALNFSEKAREKLEKAGCEFKTILNALRKGEKLQGEIIR